MKNFKNYEFFLSTARHGNFAMAAREAGVDASTVAKSVSRLEKDLGVTLFHRNTRRVSLTHEGQKFLERFEKIVGELQELESTLKEGRTEASGTLRMTAPLTMGKHQVIRAIETLSKKHKNLRFDLRLTDDRLDLIKDGIDIALRAGELDDSRLIAKTIGQQNLVVCASPTFLNKHGTPKKPSDLHRHQCLVFRIPSHGRIRPWHFKYGGQSIKLELQSSVAIDEGEALVEAAAHHMGLIQVPDFMAHEKLKRKELKEVLTEYRPPSMAIRIVYPQSKFIPQKTRVMIEALMEQLKI